jgi:hypothetical protein
MLGKSEAQGLIRIGFLIELSKILALLNLVDLIILLVIWTTH